MSEDEDQTPRKLELSPVQVAASALAAVSAAFFASWAGTAGTLIGAAVGSIIATVGAATYSYSLKRTSEIARRTAVQVREGALLPSGLPRRRPGTTGGTDETLAMPSADGEVGTQDQPDEAGPWWRRLDPRGKDLPWGKVALACAAVMLVTMAVLTSFEGLTGRSVSGTVRGDDTGRTTVGNVFGGDSSTEQQPEEQPSPQPDDATTPDVTTPAPSPSETTTEDPIPTPSPTPSSTPTEAPTPEDPGTDPDAGSQPDAGTPDDPAASPSS